MENVHDFDIRRRGRRWTPEEIERKWREHPEIPHRLELIDGKLFLSDGQRITMLGWMLEQLGADAAVKLGDPQIWREAVEDLTGQQECPYTRVSKLEALADEVRNVIENAGWRDRNLYWPDGVQHVERRLKELDREDSQNSLEEGNT